MKIVRNMSMAAVFALAVPVYATTVNASAGIPCSSAPACTGGPWVNGYQDVGSGNFISQDPSEPGNFNQYLGNDGNSGSNASFSWAITYAALPGGATINSATLELALFDHDSAVAGDQVSLFTLDGIDLTAALNTQLNGSGGGELQYNIYNFVIPGSVFASLADGTLNIVLNFTAGGVSPIGFPELPPSATTFNGAGVDYSTLSIDYTEEVDPGPEVPEPSTFSLLGFGAAAGYGMWRVRRKNAA